MGEVAARLSSLVLGDPAGRVPDLGGPRVEDSEEMVHTYLSLVRRRPLMLPIPAPGRIAAAFRAGGHLLSDGERGTRTFEEYIRSRIRPDGSIEPPYDLMQRLWALTKARAVAGATFYCPAFELSYGWSC